MTAKSRSKGMKAYVLINASPGRALEVAKKMEGVSGIVKWDQVKGAINNTASFTKAATFTCLKSVLAHDVLCNAGFYRAIEVIAPPGNVAPRLAFE